MYRIIILLVGISLLIGCEHEAMIVEGAENFDTISVSSDVVTLSKKVRETSGLTIINGDYWTHNDSGDDPYLYQINVQTGQVEQQVKVPNAQNIDWEEITTDSQFLYMADFGNNLGKRKNLVIYKFPIDQLFELDKSDVQKIYFSYPDQTEFPGNYKHNHDAEAMISVGDHLYIFSKNWLDAKCKLYRITKEPGDQQAELISEYDTKGIITGAVVADSTVTLLGYIPGNGFDPFIWELRDYKGDDFFSGTADRYNLDIRQQTEAIHVEADHYLISSEAERSGEPMLYRLTIP